MSTLATLLRRPEDDPRTPPPGVAQAIARLASGPLDPGTDPPLVPQPVRPVQPTFTGALPDAPPLPVLVPSYGDVPDMATVDTRRPVTLPVAAPVPAVPTLPRVPMVDRSGAPTVQPRHPNTERLAAVLAGAGALAGVLGGQGSAVQHMGFGLVNGARQGLETVDAEQLRQEEALATWLRRAQEADRQATAANVAADGRATLAQYQAQRDADALAARQAADAAEQQARQQQQAEEAAARTAAEAARNARELQEEKDREARRREEQDRRDAQRRAHELADREYRETRADARTARSGGGRSGRDDDNPLGALTDAELTAAINSATAAPTTSNVRTLGQLRAEQRRRGGARPAPAAAPRRPSPVAGMQGPVTSSSPPVALVTRLRTMSPDDARDTLWEMRRAGRINDAQAAAIIQLLRLQ